MGQCGIVGDQCDYKEHCRARRYNDLVAFSGYFADLNPSSVVVNEVIEHRPGSPISWIDCKMCCRSMLAKTWLFVASLVLIAKCAALVCWQKSGCLKHVTFWRCNYLVTLEASASGAA
jgi:hypothetical protein